MLLHGELRTLHMRRVTDDDRRQQPLLVWPHYTMCRRASNNSISYNYCYFAVIRGVKYCNQSVCLYVYVSVSVPMYVCLSKLHNISTDRCHMWPWFGSSSDNSFSGFVDDVMLSHNEAIGAELNDLKWRYVWSSSPGGGTSRRRRAHDGDWVKCATDIPDCIVVVVIRPHRSDS